VFASIYSAVCKLRKFLEHQINRIIDEQGKVLETKVESGLTKECDEAAVAAIKAVKWEAAMQRDKPVKVWVSVPVLFRLNNSQ